MSNEIGIDINRIMDLLPHRYPFLLVDRVLKYTPRDSITAIKNVTINEPFFPGHFSYYPVMPGVLVVEAMAQAAAVLSFKTMGSKPSDDSVYYFAGIDNARFKKPVLPGDQLLMVATYDRERAGIYKFHVEATVDGELVAEANITCAIRPKGI